MSSTDDKSATIYILGKYDCPRVTHCQAIVSDVIAKIGSIQKTEFITCFETEFDTYREELLKDNKEFIDFTQSPLIYLVYPNNSKKIIGSLEEFRTYIIENYNYHDIRQTEEFEAETKQNLKDFLENNGNKYVYFSFGIDGEDPNYDKVILEIFEKDCPLTSENFVELCKGFTNNKGQKISYNNTIIHRISKNSFIQGGDIRLEGDHSIYGANFNDENYTIKHNSKGILGMVKKGGRNHTNESQFYITLCPLESFNGKFVAFGRVIQGYETIKAIGNLETDLQRTIKRVYVKHCGEYKIE
jgi:peptidyl-prolyl cis-trans isomerase-like 6